MDPYTIKLTEMRGYVPFLNKMISKLEMVGDPSKNDQLSKMKSLLAVLNDKTKKLRLETLTQCEDVLHKLYEKVEGRQLYQSSQKKVVQDKYESQSVPSTPDSPGPSPRSPSPPPVIILERERPRAVGDSTLSSYLQRVYDDQYHPDDSNRSRRTERVEQQNSRFQNSGPRWQQQQQHHDLSSRPLPSNNRPLANDPWMRRDPAIQPWAGGRTPREPDSWERGRPDHSQRRNNQNFNDNHHPTNDRFRENRMDSNREIHFSPHWSHDQRGPSQHMDNARGNRQPPAPPQPHGHERFNRDQSWPGPQQDARSHIHLNNGSGFNRRTESPSGAFSHDRMDRGPSSQNRSSAPHDRRVGPSHGTENRGIHRRPSPPASPTPASASHNSRIGRWSEGPNEDRHRAEMRSRSPPASPSNNFDNRDRSHDRRWSRDSAHEERSRHSSLAEPSWASRRPPPPTSPPRNGRNEVREANPVSKRPPPPDSPPGPTHLVTPQSPKREPSVIYEKTKADEAGGPRVIPLERKVLLPTQQQQHLNQRQHLFNEKPPNIPVLSSPASPTPANDEALLPQRRHSKYDVIESPASPPLSVQGALHLPAPIPTTGPQHIPNSPSASESPDKFTLPPPTSLHRFQRTPIQSLTPGNQPVSSVPPQTIVNKRPALLETPRPALLDTPPEWQRITPGVNTPLPPRNNHNLRPPLVHPRHPYVRPPGPAQQPPFQRPPGPSQFPPFQRPPAGVGNQRPLTYGEYRKMREDYEKRFAPPPHMMPQRTPSPTPPTTTVTTLTTTTPTPVMKNRDPRLAPKDGSTASGDMAADEGITPAVDVKPLSKFKIPKKKRIDSESSSNSLQVKDEPSSDSENELRIVENETEETSLFDGRRRDSTTDDDNDSTITTKREETTSKTDHDDDDDDEKRQKLIKEKLSQMVGSLGPEEARKLLERVGSNQNKLTLDQLQSMLNSVEVKDENVSVKDGIIDEEIEEKSTPSTPTSSNEELSPFKETVVGKRGRGGGGRGRSPAKQRPTPTPGTRRSTRLHVVTPDFKDEAGSDDDKQLVIDEGNDSTITEGETDQTTGQINSDDVICTQESHRRGRGGRGGRGGGGRRGGGRTRSGHETAPDDVVSNSIVDNLDSNVADPNIKVKIEPDEKIDVSPADKKVDNAGPKSKTWFPGSRDARSQGKGFSRGFLSPSHGSPSSPLPKIKVEKKEADLKVFLGPEIICNSDLNPFSPKVVCLPEEVSLGVKSRLSSVSSLFDKLKNLSAQKLPDESKSEGSKDQQQLISGQPNKNSTAAVQSITQEEQPVDIITTEEPKAYASSVQSIIDRLAQKVQHASEDSESREMEHCPSLLDVIKTLKEESEDESVLEEHLEEDTSSSLDVSFDENVIYKKSAESSQGFKDDVSMQELLKIVKLKHLFKCMAKTGCSFSSDNAAKFRVHLEEVHAVQKIKLRHGWLRCSCCLKKLCSPSRLVSHVIAKHGSSSFQCPHCLFRDQSQLGLHLHQQTLHGDKPKGFITCKSFRNPDEQNVDEKQFTVALARTLTCQEKLCSFETDSTVEMSNHLFVDHTHNVKDYSDFACAYCKTVYTSVSRLVVHVITSHPSRPTVVLVKNIERAFKDSDISSIESLSDSEENESDEKSADKTTTGNDDLDVTDGHAQTKALDSEPIRDPADDGLVGHSLFRCGNAECQFSAERVFEFRDHISICEFSANAVYLDCYHCKKPFKHVNTLIDHLKNHGLKRYSCSLCTSYRCAGPFLVKSHMRTVHKVTNIKISPVNILKTNPDDDYFIAMPKNALPKGIRTAIGTKSKDTFSPEEIGDIPKAAVLKYLLRCSVCDFVTKVRLNLIKHLKLHLHRRDVEDKIDDVFVPIITPINQPESEDGSLGFAKMSSLLDADTEEEKARQPMSESELAQMPVLVPESLRFACSDKYCGYIAIDEVMLAYHINTLHPDQGDVYICPHCPPESTPEISFSNLEFHLRCHGEMLYKCGHCLYYHWQKRTAEKHVAENHYGFKQYVRDVRLEAERIAKINTTASKVEVDKKKPKEKKPPPIYQPYKCGLCELSHENLEGIKEHCRSVHEISSQFKCSMCDVASDSKTVIEKHVSLEHLDLVNSLSMIRIFYVDPSSVPQATISEQGHDEKRWPLWRRDMPGLKHIRGILYEEYPNQHVAPLSSSVGTASANSVVTAMASRKKSAADEDMFAMNCRACGLHKKTIKGLKMHIKLLHLRSGRFQCVRCQFTANMLNSIYTHYKIQHPDAENPDFVERTTEGQNFSHDFWKENWGIPTLQERIALLASGQHKPESSNETSTDLKKRKLSDSADEESPTSNKPKKRGPKVKKMGKAGKMKIISDSYVKPEVEQDETVLMNAPSVIETSVPCRKNKDFSVQEISPFENVPTYKCTFCSKRSQDLKKIEQHLRTEHSTRSGSSENETGENNFESGYKTLTRDQVVDLLTMSATSSHDEHSTESKFICYYCEDVVGPIYEMKDHFTAEHDAANDAFKVKRVQDSKKVISGYLECQICGYLTPGFDRSKQRVHYHEEHPTVLTINASKYVSKTKPNQSSTTGGQDSGPIKFDASKYIGMTILCPKSDCSFDTKAMPAMNNHLRRHTQTFKCGHCGKTFPNSSEFHQHSAMTHGNKIPDLVKDPEAEAEFEALRGLIEANLQNAYLKQQSEKRSLSTQQHGNPPKKPRFSSEEEKNRPSKTTARKSSKGHIIPPLKKEAVARKSTNSGTSRLRPFSYYGIPVEPIDLSTISTRMSISGMEITLNATKMAEILNLKPIVRVKKCKI